MSFGNWATRHAQNAVGALGALSRSPVATVMTVAVIGIALALPAALGVLVESGRSLAGGWADIRDFSVYLEPDASRERADTLHDDLSARTGIESVRLITPEAALAELGRDAAFEGALAALETNPLPHTLVIRPEQSLQPAELAALGEELRALPGVDAVKLDLDWAERLNAGLDVLRRLGALLAGLMAIAVVVIVGNTIRLDIQNRAREIEVSKLLGATDAFVRRPFLYLGLWYGILGGLVATLLLVACLLALDAPLRRLAALYEGDFSLGGPGLPAVALVLCAGVAVGWVGAWTAVARHLSAIQPR